MHEQSTAYKRLAGLYRRLVRDMRAEQYAAYRTFMTRIPMRQHVEMLPPRIMFSAAVSNMEILRHFAEPRSALTSAITINANGSAAPAPQTTQENTSLIFSSANGNAITAVSGSSQVELEATHGTLTLAETSGLSFQIGDGTSDATVEFSGSISAMNAALNGLIFAPTTGFVGSASLAVTSINWGFLGLGILGSSSTDTIAISVTAPPPPVNQPPAIQPPPAQTTPEGTALVLSGSSAMTVSDADSDGYKEQLTLNATGGTMSLSGTNGLTFSVGSGTNSASMTFTGTLVNLNAALNGLTYTPNALFYGTGGIAASINDLGNTGTGGDKIANASVTINVSQVNQPPTLTIPTLQTAAENTPLVFSSANGNAITVGDSDSNGNNEEVTLSTAGGLLSLGTASGVNVIAGVNGSADVGFTGSIAALNNALNGLTFNPTADFTGTATISININDLGNSGSGGALSANGVASVNLISSLIVTTSSDVNDGNTSSINALLANPGSDGKISLREAIIAANNTPGVHEIAFNIPGGGPQTIAVTTPLPAITRSVIIDGTTQPGYSGSPLIDLNGNAAASGTIGLSVETSNCTFKGLAIDGFSGNGIDVLPVGANNITIQADYIGLTALGVANFNGDGVVLANSANDTVGGTTAAERNIISGNYFEGVHIFGSGSTGDVVSGNYIGTDPTGTIAIPNGRIGVFIDGASGNTIGLATAGGGNVIAGNTSYGIEVGGSSPANNLIQGNLIGVNVSGTVGLANGNGGIYLNAATGTVIGGTTSAVRNVISGNNNSGNTADGVWIAAGASNIVQGNYIGVDASGNAGLANGSDGILIQNSPNNQIGGAVAGAGNVISDNGNYGLEIDGLSSSGNVAAGNLIGVNADSTAGLTNGNDGIFLSDTTGNTIGGITAGAGNVIGGNTHFGNAVDGIWINSGSSNTVQGNFIGTNASGTTGLGNNNYGVEIESSSNNVIGGTVAGAGNVIAYNDKGVSIWGTGAIDNSIRGNSIYANTVIGIDLGNDGMTSNTGTTNSSLANIGMNFPVFTSVALTGFTLTISGYVGTVPGQSAFAGAQIDLFQSDNSSTNGQGQTYLGTMTADGSGNFTGSLTVSGLVIGDTITATATDSSGDTSEFAANAVVQVVNQPPQILAPSTASTGENVPILFSQNRGNSITIVDADADGGIEQASISVASGSLTLAETAGLTFINGTADGSNLLTFTGTLSAINTALDGLLFTPAQDSVVPIALHISADDLGHTGAGGPQTANTSVALTIDAVANTPSVSNASTDENQQTAAGLVITASPSDGLAQGYYQITQIAGGTLYLDDGLTPVGDGQFITFSQGAAGLKFTPATDSIANGSFNIQAAVSPSSTSLVGNSISATIAVTAGPVAHDPTVTDSSTVENLQTTTGLVITPNSLDDPSATWFQITNITAGTLFQSDGVTPIQDGDFITAADGAAGLKFTPSPDSTAIGGFAVQASNAPDASGLGGDLVSAAIGVTAPIAPVNNVPASQSGAEDTSLVFSAANGNAIIISDQGSDGLAEQVTLRATGGTLTLASTADVTLISGTGVDDASVTLDGSAASINAALNGLAFTPNTHYYGAATIHLVTSDLSAAGIANSLSTASNVGITVVPPAALPGTPGQPVELGILPVNQSSSPVTPAAPPSPILIPPPSSSGTQTTLSSTTPDTPAPSADNNPQSSPATPSAAPQRSSSAPASLASPAGNVVTPIIAQSLTARNADVELTAPPSSVRDDVLELSAQDTISLARGEHIVMEIGDPLADAEARANGIFALLNRNNRGYAEAAPVALAVSSPLWRDLDRMQEQMTSEHRMHVVAGAASLASIGVSVMYFMWAVRAGSVLSSLLSSMPAWKLVDPLPILDQVAVVRRRKGGGDGDEENETLESMVNGAQTPV